MNCPGQFCTFSPEMCKNSMTFFAHICGGGGGHPLPWFCAQFAWICGGGCAALSKKLPPSQPRDILDSLPHQPAHSEGKQSINHNFRILLGFFLLLWRPFAFIFASIMRGCVHNHWLEDEKIGRSAHHLDIERLIGRYAYPILEGQICLPFC